MHIGEWHEKGCPENEWFTIVRHESLDCVNDGTPILLATLIEHALKSYGDFETRRYQWAIFDSYCRFEHSGHKFVMTTTTGFVNGEEVPVMAMGIEARITKSLPIQSNRMAMLGLDRIDEMVYNGDA